MFTTRLSIAIMAAAAGLTMSQHAEAVPLVYQCRLIDYLNAGPEITEFQYSQLGEAKIFSSTHSEVRFYLEKNHHLIVSLRPRSNENSIPVARAEGFDLPKRIALSLSAGGGSDFANRLDCSI